MFKNNYKSKFRNSITLFLFLVLIMNFACIFKDKEKAQLKKDAELSKREAEVAKKEAELAKKTNSSSSSSNEESLNQKPQEENKSDATDISGNWTVNYKFTDGSGDKMQWKLKQKGNSLIVSSYSNVGGNSGVWINEPNGKIDGNKVTIFMSEKGETISYNGTLNGDSMKGTMSFGGTWQASRK